MKKKTSVYIFVPLIAMVLFFAYYWNFTASFEQKQEERAAAIRKIRDARLAEENVLRLKAVNDAIAVQAKRKQEREAREAKARQEDEDRTNALQARDKAHAEAFGLRDKVERLSSQVKIEQAEVDRIEADKKSDVAELDFLQIDVKQAQDNVQSLTDVLEKIRNADIAIAAAQRAAAIAAQKKEQ